MDHTELLEGVVNQLIDEEALGVCFEMHRAIKLGYYELLYPDDRYSGLGIVSRSTGYRYLLILFLYFSICQGSLAEWMGNYLLSD